MALINARALSLVQVDPEVMQMAIGRKLTNGPTVRDVSEGLGYLVGFIHALHLDIMNTIDRLIESKAPNEELISAIIEYSRINSLIYSTLKHDQRIKRILNYTSSQDNKCLPSKVSQAIDSLLV